MNVLIFFSGIFIAVPLFAAWWIDRRWQSEARRTLDE